MPGRYELRHAAGLYWLLDTWQDGVPYRKPLVFNEAGARIWAMTAEGLDEEQIAERLCGEYEADKETVLRDVRQFRERLRERGADAAGPSIAAEAAECEET